MYDYETVRGWALAAIALRGEDYIYDRPEGESGCKYVHTNSAWDGSVVFTPGCIIGLMLINAGLTTMDKFMKTSRYYAADPHYNGVGAYELIMDGKNGEGPLAGHDFTYKAERFMSSVQGFQDFGDSWGLAVDKATARLQTTTETGWAKTCSDACTS